MKIAVLTPVYNESQLLPFFLDHYKDWDQIRILMDEETTDNSVEICKQFPNVVVEPCHMTSGMNELEKIAMLQNAFDRMKEFEWIALPDIDEFILPPKKGLSCHEFLQRQTDYACVCSLLLLMWRHITDLDLDYTKPVVPQRLHGVSQNCAKFDVLRHQSDVKITIGCETMEQPLKLTDISREFFICAHWQGADLSFSIPRKLLRRRRLSNLNLKMGWGGHMFFVTEESVRAEAKSHENDPIINELATLVGV